MTIVDDFGTLWIRGYFTNQLAPAHEMVHAGPILPTIRSSFHHWDVPSHLEARRQSYRDFCDCEQNCNTCKHLTRLKSEKSDSFLNGLCQKTGFTLRFHPHDPLHMECYESRWATGT